MSIHCAARTHQACSIKYILTLLSLARIPPDRLPPPQPTRRRVRIGRSPHDYLPANPRANPQRPHDPHQLPLSLQTVRRAVARRIRQGSWHELGGINGEMDVPHDSIPASAAACLEAVGCVGETGETKRMGEDMRIA